MPAPPDPPRLVNTQRFFMNVSEDRIDDVIHLLSPDVTYTVPGRSSLSGVCHGPAEVRSHLAQLFAFTRGTYDVLKWVDWLVGEIHVAAYQYTQMQRNGIIYRGHQMFLVQTDHNDALSDIRVLFENEEDAGRFFSN
jgi:ketosteroid isomerase-like protein